MIQKPRSILIGRGMKPGEDIIKVVPKNDQLVVEARVCPADRAFIHVGQRAVVKLSSYDFSICGGLTATGLRLSQDTFEDQKGNTHYNVRVETDKTHPMHAGERKEITTGMVATADILTGKKTVMQYLLKPFVKTLDNAMNERQFFIHCRAFVQFPGFRKSGFHRRKACGHFDLEDARLGWSHRRICGHIFRVDDEWKL
ncbi:MAG: HlyD family efflux transporter periplasmic adaptor subunit [Micavibrio sp.]|nr:HlyD family efflux transporter periplasmic adaptor subunit [Micavibrio sp.]